MVWNKVALVIFVVFNFSFMIISSVMESRNTLPYGKRAVKKLVEKTDRIYDANRIAKKEILVHKDGVVLPVKVVEQDTMEGLEYSTIPMYKCLSVYIKDEEVVRIHNIYSQSKNNYYLEFTATRKQNEIIEIIDAAYNVAQPIYNEHRNRIYCDKRMSFYGEDEI